MNALRKGIIVAVLCTTLLFLGLTCNNNAATQYTENTSKTPRITLWKDKEGVIHIENEPSTTSIAQDSQNTSTVPETATSPDKTPEEKNLHAQKAEAASRQAEAESLQLQEQHKQLEHLFIRARNKGDGYAQIRLRHLLNANKREQERLRSRTPNQP